MTVLLPLKMQQQEQANWCWAAVASSVGAYLQNSNPAGLLSQCQIVTEVLQQPDCCSNGDSSLCNKEWYLDSALAYVGHLNGSPFQGAASFASICTLTSVPYNLPIGVLVSNGVTGHFVLIIGFNNDNGNEWVYIADPCYGYGTYTLADFMSAYHGYMWTYTYPIK